MVHHFCFTQVLYPTHGDAGAVAVGSLRPPVAETVCVIIISGDKKNKEKKTPISLTVAAYCSIAVHHVMQTACVYITSRHAAPESNEGPSKRLQVQEVPINLPHTVAPHVLANLPPLSFQGCII